MVYFVCFSTLKQNVYGIGAEVGVCFTLKEGLDFTFVRVAPALVGFCFYVEVGSCP